MAMVNINSLSFDLTDCELRKDSPEVKAWMHADGIAHLLTFQQGPIDWPFDLTMLDEASHFYADQCASVGGAMISMDIFTADKVEVLRGLFKYRSPENPLAIYFVGILWVPFSNFRYQLNIEAVEQGMTGYREAVVFAMDPNAWDEHGTWRSFDVPTEAEEAEPVVVATAEDMFDRMKKTPLRALPSDDEQYDEQFESHPLSLVRSRMNRVSETLAMDKMWWQSIKPFRVRR
jgi:hypothetical protein